MAPQLFHRQIEDGAWGITLASPQQVRVAYEWGVKRILLANQVVSADAIDWLQRLLDEDPELDVTCLVDSLEGVSRLDASARGQRPNPGVTGTRGPRWADRRSRCGAALAVGRAVRSSGHLRLRGVECYEGIVLTADAAADRARVEAWLDACGVLARRCNAEELFETDEVLLTAGGSAYFNLVVKRLSAVDLGRRARVLLRSGCYLFHDAGQYERLLTRLEDRLPEAWRVPGGLQPAIEIWGRVLSRPERALAILDFGKRDVSYDLDLPRPLFQAHPGHGARPIPEDAGWKVVSLYDQHARLALPPDAEYHGRRPRGGRREPSLHHLRQVALALHR